jgi:hypothetical protein
VKAQNGAATAKADAKAKPSTADAESPVDPAQALSPKAIISVAALVAVASQFFPWLTAPAPTFGSVSVDMWSASWVDALVMTLAGAVAFGTVTGIIAKEHWKPLPWLPHFWVPAVAGAIIAGDAFYGIGNGGGIASGVSDEYANGATGFGAYLAFASGVAIVWAGSVWRREQEFEANPSSEALLSAGSAPSASPGRKLNAASSDLRATAPAQPETKSPRPDVLVSLTRLKKIKDQGFMSDEEFDAKRKELIDQEFS